MTEKSKNTQPVTRNPQSGFIQVYTGNGKGKSTAAFGLAIRAAGAGHKVFIAQFVKGGQYSEIKALGRFSDLITIRQYGAGRLICKKPDQEDITAAKKGLQEVREILEAGEFQVVILDEANISVSLHLFSVEELLEIIEARPPQVELVITGRNAHQKIMDRADLVTEMKEIKHYYSKGVKARIGIEK